jgi:hypothetical protein
VVHSHGTVAATFRGRSLATQRTAPLARAVILVLVAPQPPGISGRRNGAGDSGSARTGSAPLAYAIMDDVRRRSSVGQSTRFIPAESGVRSPPPPPRILLHRIPPRGQKRHPARVPAPPTIEQDCTALHWTERRTRAVRVQLPAFRKDQLVDPLDLPLRPRLHQVALGVECEPGRVMPICLAIYNGFLPATIKSEANACRKS